MKTALETNKKVSHHSPTSNKISSSAKERNAQSSQFASSANSEQLANLEQRVKGVKGVKGIKNKELNAKNAKSKDSNASTFKTATFKTVNSKEANLGTPKIKTKDSLAKQKNELELVLLNGAKLDSPDSPKSPKSPKSASTDKPNVSVQSKKIANQVKNTPQKFASVIPNEVKNTSFDALRYNSTVNKENQILEKVLFEASEQASGVNFKSNAPLPLPLPNKTAEALARSANNPDFQQAMASVNAEVFKIKGGAVLLSFPPPPAEFRPPRSSLSNLVLENRWKELEKRLKSKVNPNTRDDKGLTASWTPLYWSVKLGHVECVRLLLSFGADVNMVISDIDECSGTVLDLVSIRGDSAMEAVLREHVRKDEISINQAFRAIRTKLRGRAPAFNFRQYAK